MDRRIVLAAAAAIVLVSSSLGGGPVARAGDVVAAAGSVTVGSNQSEALPKAAFKAMMAYCATQTGVTPTVRTFDHAKFQDGITAYLRGTPADVFTWFGGEKMRSLVRQHLVRPVTDVWAGITGEYSAAMKAASTASDGKQYLVPTSSYPWVFLYRKSLFAAKGYAVPTTFDELIALAKRMRADGLVPMASADLDGWPAMGTFDILDMRINGFRFHMDLMAGRAKWTDPRVKAVFLEWKKLLPYTQPGALGRTWQQGMQALVDESAGTYFMGTFAADQATDPAVFNDLGMFAFPTLGTAYDAEMAIDAPIDGLMLSKTGANPTQNTTLLECLATGPAELAFLKTSPNNVAANKTADTSGYTDFQKQMATILAGSNKIAQFLDRDTRPDFAGPNGMQGFLQTFLNDPAQDLDAYLAKIQAFWDSLPPQ